MSIWRYFHSFFIMRQHTLHAESDIVTAFCLSVCLYCV